MADYSIGAEQIGVYEIPLSAGKTITVNIKPRYNLPIDGLQISVHDADHPVYVKAGTAVTPREQGAIVVSAGTWVTLPTSYNQTEATIALTSSGDAIISISRA
jgi:hypothetical protein